MLKGDKNFGSEQYEAFGVTGNVVFRVHNYGSLRATDKDFTTKLAKKQMDKILGTPPPAGTQGKTATGNESASTGIKLELDGKIAFAGQRVVSDGGQELGIFVMNADGSNITLIGGIMSGDEPTGCHAHSQSGAFPSWSPDGTKVVFSCSGGMDSPIYVVNADGSNLKTPVKLGPNGQAPSWSPDGDKIAFSNGQIYVINADGSNPIQLTDNDDGGYNPSWSPDGDKIAFSNGEIYVINADGSNSIQLTDNDVVDTHLLWSPDGQHILFTSQRDGELNSQLYVMNADGSSQTNLTNDDDGKSTSRQPSWSPISP